MLLLCGQVVYETLYDVVYYIVYFTFRNAISYIESTSYIVFNTPKVSYTTSHVTAYDIVHDIIKTYDIVYQDVQHRTFLDCSWQSPIWCDIQCHVRCRMSDVQCRVRYSINIRNRTSKPTISYVKGLFLPIVRAIWRTRSHMMLSVSYDVVYNMHAAHRAYQPARYWCYACHDMYASGRSCTAECHFHCEISTISNSTKRQLICYCQQACFSFLEDTGVRLWCCTVASAIVAARGSTVTQAQLAQVELENIGAYAAEIAALNSDVHVLLELHTVICPSASY